MSYVERKKINGRFYLYLYETYRVLGEKYPKRRMLRYLGSEENFPEFEKLKDELTKI